MCENCAKDHTHIPVESETEVIPAPKKKYRLTSVCAGCKCAILLRRDPNNQANRGCTDIWTVNSEGAKDFGTNSGARSAALECAGINLNRDNQEMIKHSTLV